jgi:predicted PurR-regulated permease PerM
VTTDDHPTSAGTQLRRWGTSAWYIVGILLAGTLVYVGLVALSGVVVPVLMASVVAMLAVGVIDWLEARRVPRSIGALVLIAAVLAVFVGVGVIVIRGIIDEADEIRLILIEGLDVARSWVADGTGDRWADDTFDRSARDGRRLLLGAAGWVTTVFSTAVAFAIGTFFAVVLAFFVLVDWPRVRASLARRLPVPTDVGIAIIDDSVQVVRRGFSVLTLTSLITSVVIGVAMLVLDLPLALAVAIVTFFTSYIPYVGAFVSGAFGFLIALGSGGPTDAIVLLTVILVAQNLIQAIVANQLTTTRMSIRPIASIVASGLGVAVAGLLGAILAVPTLGIVLAVRRRLRVEASLDPLSTAPADQSVGDGTRVRLDTRQASEEP